MIAIHWRLLNGCNQHTPLRQGKTLWTELTTALDPHFGMSSAKKADCCSSMRCTACLPDELSCDASVTTLSSLLLKAACVVKGCPQAHHRIRLVGWSKDINYLPLVRAGTGDHGQPDDRADD